MFVVYLCVLLFIGDLGLIVSTLAYLHWFGGACFLLLLVCYDLVLIVCFCVLFDLLFMIFNSNLCFAFFVLVNLLLRVCVGAAFVGVLVKLFCLVDFV